MTDKMGSLKRVIIFTMVVGLIMVQPVVVLGLTGVGALADRVSENTLISVTGKTAPWAEVVIVDPENDDRIYVTAEIEPDGDFSFNFRVDNAVLSRLQIFAIDELGTSSRVGLVENLSGVILLPPTIVNDPDDPVSTTRVALTGYTYPGSQVELELRSDQGYDENFLIAADGVTGKWSYIEEDLPSGKYAGVAVSRNGLLVSEESQEIFFEITAIPVPEEVVEVIREILEIIPPGVRELVTERQEEIARVVAPVAAVPVLAVLLPDLIAILLKLLLGLLHLLGWKRDRRSWGLFYDALSKEPLARVIVRLYRLPDGKLMETDVTGKEGVFAFLPTLGKYFIKVVKAGYEFPSELVRGRGRDGEYEYIYHGEEFEVKDPDEQLKISIPVDPERVELDWRFQFKRILWSVWNVVGVVLLLIGFGFALASLLRVVSWLNVLVFLFYVTLLIYQTRGALKVSRRFGVVKDVETGQAVKGVSIALYEVEFKRLIQRRVSNEQGKFLLVVPGGRYRLEVAAVGWEVDYEHAKKKGGYQGEEIVVRGEKSQTIQTKIWVRRKS